MFLLSVGSRSCLIIDDFYQKPETSSLVLLTCIPWTLYRIKMQEWVDVTPLESTIPQLPLSFHVS